MRWLTSFFLICTVLFFPAAQELEDSPPDPVASERSSSELKLSPTALQILEDELIESDYGDLVLWLKELGLSAEGDSEVLAARIREYYGISEISQDIALPPSEEDEGTLIVIEAADSLESFTIDEYSEQYLRLSGRIRLRMEDQERNQTHTIVAHSIVLNRSTKSLTARGDIVYTLRQRDQVDTFTGDSLSINVETWEGIFLGGLAEITPDAAGREKFFFQGESFTRSGSNVVIFEDVSIFSQDTKTPYYSISAKKLWILAPDEWAILHPVLKLGHVPIFYLPFFFQNGDRFFFRPSIGIHSDFGYFIHTTTYLYGQATEDGGSGLSVLQLASQRGSQERVIDGLFLRVADDENSKDEKEIPDNWMLKFMLDGYQHLGFYMATEGSFQGLAAGSTSGGFSPFSFRVGIAFSRVLFYVEGRYVERVRFAEFDGDPVLLADYWTHSYLFSLRVPFRYEFSFDMGWRGNGLSFLFSAELYSDRYIKSDFYNRSESFDWNFALGQGIIENDTSDISTFSWDLSTNYSPSYGEHQELRKYLNFSLSSLSAELLFSSKEVPTSFLPAILGFDDAMPNNTPQRYPTLSNPEEYFFYPSLLVIPDLRISLSGTLIDYQYSRSTDPAVENRERFDEEYENERRRENAVELQPLQPPWDEDDEFVPDQPTEDLPPLFQASPVSSSSGTLFSFNLSYRITPQLRIEIPTAHDSWDDPEAIVLPWAKYIRLESRNSASINYGLSLFHNRFSLSNSLSSNFNFDMLLMHNADLLTDAEVDYFTELFASNSRQDLFHNLSASLRPFIGISAIERSALRYTLNTMLFRRSFEAMSANNIPIFALERIEWSDDFVQTHNAGLDVFITVLGSQQSLSISTTLPPHESTDLSLKASIVTGPVATTFSTRFNDLTNDDSYYDPLSIQSVYRQGDFLTFSQRFVVDLEEKELTESYSSLSLSFLRNSIRLGASFSAKKETRYDFNRTEYVWEEETATEALRPRSATAYLDVNYEFPPFWKNRIKIKLFFDTRLSLDLLRFTNSSLSLQYGLTLSIYKSISLSASVNVVNSSLYRYIPSLANQIGSNLYVNFFDDLARSLNVASRSDLESALFKLRDVQIRISQDFGAWDFGFSYTGSPKLNSDGSEYQWNNFVNFYVNWNIIEELRTNVEFDDDELTLSE